MKFQPKRFVVEVKRGTSRAAFASPDASTDRFSSAEAVLFGAPGRSAPKSDAAAALHGASNGASRGAAGAAPSGRILRSLVEPPPPVVEDPEPPVRRGRKPGSKNKPKPEVPTAFPAPSPGGQGGLRAAMRSYGFADDGTVWTEPTMPAAPAAPAPNPPPVAAERRAADAGDEPARPRLRLRDRSSILKRYVLDIEPRPGQPGALRARRLARAS